MAKKSKSENAPLLIRLEMFPLFDELTNEEAGEVIKAIFEYRLYAVIPEFQDRALRTAFFTIKPLIDDDRDKYRETCERNAENGRKGGQAKANNAQRDEEYTPF